MTILCKKCGHEEYVKDGWVRGHQRYKCRACGCHYTMTPPRGKPAAMKAQVVMDYGAGKQSYGMLAKKHAVSSVTIYRWVRKAAEALPPPEPPAASVGLVMLDEMHHAVNGKKNSLDLACH
jgi:transposase-like protein